MSFFPLKYTCTIQRAVETLQRSGQKLKDFDDVAVVKCLFLETSGNKVQGPKETHQGVFAFYCGPQTDIKEGDHVIDIKDSNGQVIEPGPLYVESAKQVPSPLSGKIHHISAKVRGAVA